MQPFHLLSLPGELLLQIMESLRDSRDIQALQATALTCKTLHQVAEICLYSIAEFTTLSSLYQFLDATRTNPNRKGYLRDLSLLYSTPRYNSQESFSLPDLTVFPNLTSFVSESPECQPLSVKGTRWDLYMDAYLQAFEQASLLNPVVNTPRPLQNLRSLTLHWTGAKRRYWSVTPMCPIFLLPQLQSLEISCAGVGQGAAVGQEEPSQWPTEELECFRGKTGLRSLIFTECVVSVEALHLILSFPRALQRLDLCETFYHRSYGIGTRFAVDHNDAFNHAIAQQSENLQHLNIFCNRRFSSDSRQLVLSLSNFPVLSYLQIGPFPKYYFNPLVPSVQYLKFVLDRPVPPVLSSLRLSDQAISIQHIPTYRMFSVLPVEDLMKNARARGLPFTFDIVLAPLPEPPAQAQPTPRLTPQFVRNFVEELANEFQSLQQISTRPRPALSSELPSLPDHPNQTSSRLRVLTSKYHHKIPPFLHGERPPRFVARYDSWHPEKFLSNPYTADTIPSDWDTSSDDEDMDAVFTVRQ
ncbi:hypothetical protein GGR53DRAFT_519481 [Hypoxylon sp. FL1150]|nr:hypothetical protein GGR53DRAFT_519481 [Hypoxylon sp. FL1150]